jgi:hypothetical protein
MLLAVNHCASDPSIPVNEPAAILTLAFSNEGLEPDTIRVTDQCFDLLDLFVPQFNDST